MNDNSTVACPNDTINIMEHFGHNWAKIHAQYTPTKSLTIIFIFWLIIGVPGSILALLVWTRKGMRHSSSIYLSALAIADLLVLLLCTVIQLQQAWDIATLDFPVWCELFPTLFIWGQYCCPLLTLAFTVERFISVCFPFKHEHYCTMSRAQKVTGGILFGCLLVAMIQIAVHRYDYNFGICGTREWFQSPLGGNVLLVWTYISDLLIFAVVPFAILFFNILVIREMRKITRRSHDMGGSEEIHTKSTTITLLCVSFCLILGTLPATLVFVLTMSVAEGKTCILLDDVPSDPSWQGYLTFVIVKTTVNNVCSAHYALNFYIYMLTGAAFRQQFKKTMIDCFGRISKCGSRDDRSVDRRCYSTMTNSSRNVRVKNGIVDTTYV